MGVLRIVEVVALLGWVSGLPKEIRVGQISGNDESDVTGSIAPKISQCGGCGGAEDPDIQSQGGWASGNYGRPEILLAISPGAVESPRCCRNQARMSEGVDAFVTGPSMVESCHFSRCDLLP